MAARVAPARRAHGSKRKTKRTAPGVRPLTKTKRRRSATSLLKKWVAQCNTKASEPRGSASSLPGDSYKEWIAHCKKVAPVWLHVVNQVQHALATRITETINLKGDDVDFKKGHVVVHGLKGHGTVHKPLVPHARKLLATLKKNKVTTTRKVQCGVCRDATVVETWRWSKGYLFPRKEKEKQPAPGGCARNQPAPGGLNKKPSGSEPMSKDTVSKAMMRARATFTTDRKDVHKERITSHSLRHRWINDAKTCGIPKEVAMKYALIKDEMTYDKVYGKPTMQQAGEIIKKAKMLTHMPKFQ